jgi:hypothetical protein
MTGKTVKTLYKANKEANLHKYQTMRAVRLLVENYLKKIELNKQNQEIEQRYSIRPMPANGAHLESDILYVNSPSNFGFQVLPMPEDFVDSDAQPNIFYIRIEDEQLRYTFLDGEKPITGYIYKDEINEPFCKTDESAEENCQRLFPHVLKEAYSKGKLRPIDKFTYSIVNPNDVGLAPLTATATVQSGNGFSIDNLDGAFAPPFTLEHVQENIQGVLQFSSKNGHTLGSLPNVICNVLSSGPFAELVLNVLVPSEVEEVVEKLLSECQDQVTTYIRNPSQETHTSLFAHLQSHSPLILLPKLLADRARDAAPVSHLLVEEAEGTVVLGKIIAQKITEQLQILIANLLATFSPDQIAQCGQLALNQLLLDLQNYLNSQLLSKKELIDLTIEWLNVHTQRYVESAFKDIGTFYEAIKPEYIAKNLKLWTEYPDLPQNINTNDMHVKIEDNQITCAYNREQETGQVIITRKELFAFNRSLEKSKTLQYAKVIVLASDDSSINSIPYNALILRKSKEKDGYELLVREPGHKEELKQLNDNYVPDERIANNHREIFKKGGTSSKKALIKDILNKNPQCSPPLQGLMLSWPTNLNDVKKLQPYLNAIIAHRVKTPENEIDLRLQRLIRSFTVIQYSVETDRCPPSLKRNPSDMRRYHFDLDNIFQLGNTHENDHYQQHIHFVKSVLHYQDIRQWLTEAKQPLSVSSFFLSNSQFRKNYRLNKGINQALANFPSLDKTVIQSAEKIHARLQTICSTAEQRHQRYQLAIDSVLERPAFLKSPEFDGFYKKRYADFIQELTQLRRQMRGDLGDDDVIGAVSKPNPKRALETSAAASYSGIRQEIKMRFDNYFPKVVGNGRKQRKQRDIRTKFLEDWQNHFQEFTDLYGHEQLALEYKQQKSTAEADNHQTLENSNSVIAGDNRLQERHRDTPNIKADPKCGPLKKYTQQVNDGQLLADTDTYIAQLQEREKKLVNSTWNNHYPLMRSPDAITESKATCEKPGPVKKSAPGIDYSLYYASESEKVRAKPIELNQNIGPQHSSRRLRAADLAKLTTLLEKLQEPLMSQLSEVLSQKKDANEVRGYEGAIDEKAEAQLPKEEKILHAKFKFLNAFITFLHELSNLRKLPEQMADQNKEPLDRFNMKKRGMASTEEKYKIALEKYNELVGLNPDFSWLKELANLTEEEQKLLPKIADVGKKLEDGFLLNNLYNEEPHEYKHSEFNRIFERWEKEVSDYERKCKSNDKKTFSYFFANQEKTKLRKVGFEPEVQVRTRLASNDQPSVSVKPHPFGPRA